MNGRNKRQTSKSTKVEYTVKAITTTKKGKIRIKMKENLKALQMENTGELLQ